MNNYLVVDVETGGIDPSFHSILSISGVKWDLNHNQFLFGFLIREKKLEFTNKALGINGLTVAEICEKGLTPDEAVKDIREALNEAFGEDREPVILIGHNVGFDILFIRRLYWIAGEDFFQDFSHRSIDTASILGFLMLRGDLPDHSPNSDYLFRITNVNVPADKRHTAHYDAMATAEALTRLVNGQYTLPKE